MSHPQLAGNAAGMIAAIEAKAQRILAQSPGAVVAYRLLRDVLRQPPGNAHLQAARQELAGRIITNSLGRAKHIGLGGYDAQRYWYEDEEEHEQAENGQYLTPAVKGRNVVQRLGVKTT